MHLFRILFSLISGANMDNTVDIADLVGYATSIVVIKPMNPDGSHTLKSILYSGSPRPIPSKLRIMARSTAILSKLPNKGEGKHLFVDSPKENDLQCDRGNSQCIAFLYDEDEWGLYSFTSDVECVPISKLTAVNAALADKLRKSIASITFTDEPLQEFVRIPSHILVVEPLVPAKATRTTPSLTPEGRPYTYSVDRFSVVETLRASGTHPVPSTIELRAFDQIAKESSSTRNQNLSFHSTNLEGGLPKQISGRRIVFAWEHPTPGQYIYIADRASFPIGDLPKIRAAIHERRE